VTNEESNDRRASVYKKVTDTRLPSECGVPELMAVVGSQRAGAAESRR